ncbi:uncharacterized protein LOC127842127 isoform X2 [Dreissena polymorpha]|uniref:uncharacterized protein LOC127842127 isoform X2 n=1 Tax=Dreissena polymorpha TaxID=45954 RepID=UPI002264BDD4|nr:uncharacterized protein LOC127842127 isoform X2 [Dreissena polymorpha]
MACVLLFLACLFIGCIHSASTQGSNYDNNHYYYRDDGLAIAIGIIALSFSSLSLICIFVGLICICARKCCRQSPPAASMPGTMQYGQPLTHGQPMMHNQPAMGGQPIMDNQPATHGQPMMHNQPVMHGQPPKYGQLQ